MDLRLHPARFGVVALWRAPDDDDEVLRALTALHPDERALALAMRPLRRREWLAGRVALRAALVAQKLDDGSPLLRDDRGAPHAPGAAAASVSHKGAWAAALAAPRQQGCSIGVDIERASGPRVDIAPRVCTPRELSALAALSPVDRAQAVALRFSAKEAVYKAIDPWLRRYVGFREVEVELAGDGSGRAIAVDAPLAAELAGATLELTWESVGEHWLCTARATRSDSY